MQSSHPEPQFRISCAEIIQNKILELHHLAALHGRAEELLTALKVMKEKLTKEALTWGDPLYPLRAMKLLAHQGVQGPLQVLYAVDEQRRIVYVTEVPPLFGFPLPSKD
jgi:hypothetical protein